MVCNQPISMIVNNACFDADLDLDADFPKMSLIKITFRELCSCNGGKCSLDAFPHRQYVCFIGCHAARAI